MKNYKFILLIFLFAVQSARGQYGAIATSPGTYEYIDRSKIERNRIDWSMLVEKQDHDTYEKTVSESEAAYKDLYQSYAKLKELSIQSTINKLPISAEELASAVFNFRMARDVFHQKIAGLEVFSEVWGGRANLNPDQKQALPAEQQNAIEYVYSKGAVNLGLFAKTYDAGIRAMVDQAAALTYRYNDGMQAVDTIAGEGLMDPMTHETPRSILANLEIFRKNAELTFQDTENLSRLPKMVAYQMAQFINANDLHFYWQNDLQKQGRSDWLEALEFKFRLTKYVRAANCMSVGVVALSLPPLESFDLGYLVRGARQKVRIVQKAEFDEVAIRATLNRLDELFRSLQSQNGEFNDVGGVMGYINKINSTLTWKNEVEAYLGILTFLREDYRDELDLITDPIGRCDRVRQRYYARYKTFRDGFAARADAYFVTGGSSTDPTMQAFAVAGKVILTKGQYLKEYRKLLSDHPEFSPSGKMLDESLH